MARWLCEGCNGADWIDSAESVYEGAKMVNDLAFLGFLGDGCGRRSKVALRRGPRPLDDDDSGLAPFDELGFPLLDCDWD